MKKIRYLAAIFLVTALLVGCSKKTEPPTSSSSTKTSQTSSSSSKTDPSSSEEEVPTPSLATIDIEAISQGDFSSIIGTWKNESGDVLVFNALGLVSDDGTSVQDNPSLVDGALEAAIKTTDSPNGVRLVMIPAGTAIPNKYFNAGEDDSDKSKDRMISGQQNLDKASDYKPYYRVAPSTSTQSNPLNNDDTGVSLESGQVTIDYANSHLGGLKWQVIESNYNRTESIPFELLQGDDGSLYRVYRNGVILSEKKNVIVYMP